LLNLRKPKAPAGIRDISLALLAAVPKASIHKNCQWHPWEKEIGRANNFFRMFSPARDSMRLKSSLNHNFSGVISSAANSRHKSGALVLSQIVRIWGRTHSRHERGKSSATTP
jgi:hypothetical protein